MSKKISKTSEIGIIIGLVVILLAFIYGCYWVGKSLSYTIFYEDMVVQTIRETVMPEFLKEID